MLTHLKISMANTNKHDNIIMMPKPKKSKLGLAIGGIILMYMLVVVYGYFTSKHISGYEVKEGSLAVDNTYRGICLREEVLCQATDSGYVNYYAREGERVPHGAMVYSVDSSGRLNDLLKKDFDREDSLTPEDMNELKNQIINYRSTYTDYSFDAVYDFKFGVSGTVMKLSNKNVLDSLSQINDKAVLDLVKFGYAPQSGIVVYSSDGLETLTPADITPEIFNEEEHIKTQLSSGALVSAGDNAFKLITRENWSVIIPIDKDRREELEDRGYVQVKFLRTGDLSWGKISLFDDGNGHDFCELDFTNSMITYATDRYLDIELMLSAKRGLKIPNSAIVEKEFYLIPERYLIDDGTREGTGFIRETYKEDGSVTTEFVPAQVYQRADVEVYIDTSVFRLGEYLLTRDSLDKFAIGKKDTLIGVYNMNKGYADFTQITILYQNREYAIVKSNTDYGLAVYDHIVLDGNSVNDDDFVFE